MLCTVQLSLGHCCISQKPFPWGRNSNNEDDGRAKGKIKVMCIICFQKVKVQMFWLYSAGLDWWTVIHMTVTHSHTEEKRREPPLEAPQGAVRCLALMCGHKPTCVWSIPSPRLFSLWLMMFPFCTRQHHSTKGHCGWNKDPLIVPLSKPLGRSAGSWWVPRVQQPCTYTEARAAAGNEARRVFVSNIVELSRMNINGNSITFKCPDCRALLFLFFFSRRACTNKMYLVRRGFFFFFLLTFVH